MKTRAAVLYGPTRLFTIEEVELDEPKDGEVLLRLVATGLCHSDWHFATGAAPVRFPMVVGHEGAGIVERVGPGVTEVKPGRPCRALLHPCLRKVSLVYEWLGGYL